METMNGKMKISTKKSQMTPLKMTSKLSSPKYRLAALSAILFFSCSHQKAFNYLIY